MQAGARYWTQKTALKAQQRHCHLSWLPAVALPLPQLPQQVQGLLQGVPLELTLPWVRPPRGWVALVQGLVQGLQAAVWVDE